MRLRSAVPAGLLDSSLSSLATFAIGIMAATQLPLEALGVYSLFFTAFLLATVVPTQLIFLPAEIAALADKDPAGRKAIVRESLPLGLGPSVLAAAATASTILL